MEDALQIHIAQRDGTTILTVTGEVDLATAPVLDERIAAAEATGAERILVDLDQVSFMDSSGLQVLLAHVFSERVGSRIRLTRGFQTGLRLFAASGILEML